MKFNVDYPSEMTAPKGLYIPKLEDIQQAVKLAEMVITYEKIPDAEDYEFTITASDEVFVHQGNLVSSSDTGEGVNLYPAPSPWTLETIFESILYGLFDGGGSGCWGDCSVRSPGCTCSE